ncbi:MAG: hypothetical protein A2Y33_08455 [Spirochaetes bacterium GWF1_51_8]|nr:MAG: hypothetical protein A2Y33_08455 [Spirochaetes bacterium GWF1_51_8]
MKKIFACCLFIVGLGVSPVFSEVIEIKGFELAYGPYDIMAAPSFELFDLKGLIIKPYLRFDPFVLSLQWGINGEFFPAEFFNFNVPLIGEFGLKHFYVFTGFKFPIDFASFIIPTGIGFQIPIMQEFYFGFRIYADHVLAPVAVSSISWDFSFEYKTF